MEEINFVTMGDMKFFHFINYSAKLLKSIDPSYKYYIYDLGFTKLQKEKLISYSNVIIVDWTYQVNSEESFILSKEYASKFEYICTLKPICLLDCVTKIKSKKVVYIDGDAFVLSKINQIFNNDFEIGVTIRLDRKTIQIARKLGILMYINAGVIFFNLDLNKMKIFLNSWINEIKNTSGLFQEQTALNKLIYGSNSDFLEYYYKRNIILPSGESFNVMTFPCHKYNHYEIKLGYIPIKNKILHLKVNKYEGQIDRNSIREVILQLRLGVFYYHFLNLFPKKLRKFIKEIFSINFIVKFIINPFRFNRLINELANPIIRYINNRQLLL